MTPDFTGVIQNAFEIACAFGRRMAIERPFTGALPDGAALPWIEIDRLENVLGCRCDEDFVTRLEELVETLPLVGDDRRAAGSRLEEAARRAIPHFRHRTARDVQRQCGRTIERWMFRRRQMRDVVNVRFPSEPVGVLRTCQYKL